MGGLENLVCLRSQELKADKVCMTRFLREASGAKMRHV